MSRSQFRQKNLPPIYSSIDNLTPNYLDSISDSSLSPEDIRQDFLLKYLYNLISLTK